MRLIQFENTQGERQVGVVEGPRVLVLNDTRSTRELALAAIRAQARMPALQGQQHASGLRQRHRAHQDCDHHHRGERFGERDRRGGVAGSSPGACHG